MTAPVDVLKGKQPRHAGAYSMRCACGADTVARDGLLVCMGRLDWHGQTHTWQRQGDEWALVDTAVRQ